MGGGMEPGWILESDAFRLAAPGIKRSLPRRLDERCLGSGDGSSPDLRWSDPPSGTGSLALIFERQEPPFCQWLVYNIPPELRHLPPGIPPQESLPNGISQGLHSGGRLGYLPPALDLPRGFTRLSKGAPSLQGGDPIYRLLLVALKCPPNLPSRLTRDRWAAEVAGWILGETELWVCLPSGVSSERPKGRVA